MKRWLYRRFSANGLSVRVLHLDCTNRVFAIIPNNRVLPKAERPEPSVRSRFVFVV